jgi:Protein of unknown function (DUF3626)
MPKRKGTATAAARVVGAAGRPSRRGPPRKCAPELGELLELERARDGVHRRLRSSGRRLRVRVREPSPPKPDVGATSGGRTGGPSGKAGAPGGRNAVSRRTAPAAARKTKRRKTKAEACTIAVAADEAHAPAKGAASEARVPTSGAASEARDWAAERARVPAAIFGAHARQALARVAAESERRDSAALKVLRGRLESLGARQGEPSAVLAYVRERAAILIHLQCTCDLLDLFLRDTHYRNLFETGTSGGTPNTSARRVWEDRLFFGAYRDAAPAERCKYGVLNLFAEPGGVSRARPWYGNSFLVLRDGVRMRSTLTEMDSCSKDAHASTLDHPAAFLAALPSGDLQLAVRAAARADAAPERPHSGNYKEAQIHGELRFDRDFEALCLEPSVARDSMLRAKCEAFAAKNNLRLDLVPAIHQPF